MLRLTLALVHLTLGASIGTKIQIISYKLVVLLLIEIHALQLQVIHTKSMESNISVLFPILQMMEMESKVS